MTDPLELQDLRELIINGHADDAALAVELIKSELAKIQAIYAHARLLYFNRRDQQNGEEVSV